MQETSGPVVEWLLDGDPAIRWQVLQDLCDLSSQKVESERAKVPRQGWGARILSAQGPQGRWTGLYTPKWTSATYSLLLLKAFGLAPGNPAARSGAVVLLDAGLDNDCGINFWRPRRRCSETCVTGMVLGIASRFATGDDRIENLVDYLLNEQMIDGGWNCRRHQGATHSSLHTTILALEGLLEYETRCARQAQRTRAARERGHEFLYVHQMFKSHRTGQVIDAQMTRFSFPPQWHYDVLRGLDYLRAAKADRDPRLGPSIELLEMRRSPDGTWPLQNVHRGKYHFEMELTGKPSRWNTLRALRTLRWWNDHR